MTKEEGSDLRSLINRLVEAKLEHQMAGLRVADANHALENFLFKLENPKK